MPLDTIAQAIADVENLPAFMQEAPSIIEFDGKFDWFCLGGSKPGYYVSSVFTPVERYTVVKKFVKGKWVDVNLKVDLTKDTKKSIL